jgi:hypothetical protein
VLKLVVNEGVKTFVEQLNHTLLLDNEGVDAGCLSVEVIGDHVLLVQGGRDDRYRSKLFPSDVELRGWLPL